jgi:hypothetical protein
VASSLSVDSYGRWLGLATQGKIGRAHCSSGGAGKSRKSDFKAHELAFQGGVGAACGVAIVVIAAETATFPRGAGRKQSRPRRFQHCKRLLLCRHLWSPPEPAEGALAFEPPTPHGRHCMPTMAVRRTRTTPGEKHLRAECLELIFGGVERILSLLLRMGART